ncbi:hypothetical protein NHP200010_06910 [Helicobacter bizzozeronii]|uniref:sulfatase-like hydrolase/transferase n=1 Tax=Helicobacter bizzozeronii TaxID=56877 RepID=UPI00244D8910|nr:sulfatase-like hydrolase/transferase [Helicobacter bizzozeronii]GMB92980.1 hypothetical protein NHP200010_06910 [Helicobacter bizzozeronii]
MDKVILDNRFLLCWLAPIVAGGFSPYAHSPYLHGIKYFFAYEAKVAFYGFLVFYLFYALFALIKSPFVVKILKNTLLAISILFALINFFLSYYFEMSITPSIIDTILASSPQESSDFFKSMVLPHSGVLLGVLAVCGLFLYLVRVNVRLSRKVHTALIAMFALGISLHAIKLTKTIGGLMASGFSRIPYGAYETIKQVIPLIREGYAIYTSLKEYGNNQVIWQAIREPLPKDYLKVDSNSVPNVVLIVGESASRNFMGVYGYPVPNTPFLSGLEEREREREIAKFIRV